jgi:hypothetical protein
MQREIGSWLNCIDLPLQLSCSCSLSTVKVRLVLTGFCSSIIDARLLSGTLSKLKGEAESLTCYIAVQKQ